MATQPLFDMSQAQPIRAPLFDMSKATPLSSARGSTVEMQPQPLSWLEQRGAQLANNAASVAQHVVPLAKSAANDVYDVSTPNIATQLYKYLSGKPNTLHAIPGKAVLAWLAAGGIPEGEVAEAESAQAATSLAPSTDSAAIPSRLKAPPTEPAASVESAARPAPIKAPTSPKNDLMTQLRAMASKIEQEEAAAKKVPVVRTTKPSAPVVPDPNEDLSQLLKWSIPTN